MDNVSQRAEPNTGAFCLIGLMAFSSRGRVCLVGAAPNGTTPFIWQNNFYHTLPSSGSCPSGSTFDGQNCLLSAIPPGKTAFIDGQAMFIDCEGNVNWPGDYVNGYQSYQLQNALHNAYTKAQFKANLKGLFWNPAEGAELDLLFNDYIGMSTDKSRCDNC